MGKMQLMDASKDLITFQLGTSTDIVPGLLELLLEASEQQGGPQHQRMLKESVRTYVFHMLKSYATILCN